MIILQNPVDFLIKNGHVIDPRSHIDRVMDIAVKNGRIANISAVDCGRATVIDAEGCYVFPGFVDFHTHIFGGGSDSAIRADLMIPTGVTAAVDAGTSGSGNFDAFYQTEIAQSFVKIKSFVNISAGGLPSVASIEDFRPECCDADAIERLVDRYPGKILGLKLRFSKGIVPEGKEGAGLLKTAIEMAEQISPELAVCVHVTNAPLPAGEIAGMLREGDIFCHCYHGIGSTILDEKGSVIPEVREARRRGVIFDAANGMNNFDINVAKAALRQDFAPDIISSDITRDKFNVSPHVRNLPMVMDKFLELGLSLQEVIKAVTERPAKLMHMDGEIGTLAPGAYADICIAQLVNKTAQHLDYADNMFCSHTMLIPRLVCCFGQVVYRACDF